MVELTEHDITRLVKNWLQEVLAMSEEARAVSGPYTPEIQREEIADLERYEAVRRSDLARRDYRAVGFVAEGLLQDEGIQPDRESPSFKRLSRELVKAGVRHAQIELQRSQGAYDNDLPEVSSITGSQKAAAMVGSSPQDAPSFSRQSVEQGGEPIPVSEVFDSFEREMMTGCRWTEKTRHENRAMVNTMIEIMGNLPMASFNKAIARDYKVKLQTYPRNRHKDGRYRNKNLGQIKAMAKVDALSVTTVNNHLIKLVGFFRWAVDQGYLATNPFKRLTIPTTDRAKEKVLPFSQDDLEAIFNSPLYGDNRHRKPWQFWLPLLGLCTGARIEELCQLHLEDIRRVEGVLCFDINDKPGHSLKNKASKRVIPVHPEVIRIGFVEYADSLRKTKNPLLFPGLAPVGAKHSHYPSIWFGNLKREMGMPSRTKVFHNFRHVMADKLRKARTEDYLIKRLLGHEVGNVTHDLYGDDEALVQPLNEVLQKIDFGVDLSHIEFSS